MDFAANVLYKITLGSSIIGIILLIPGIFAMFSMFKKTHRNFRLLTSCLGLSMFLTAVSTAIAVAMVLDENADKNIFQIFVDLTGTCLIMTHLTATTMIVERIIATVASKTYEKSKFFAVLTPVYIVLNLCIGFGGMKIYNYLGFKITLIYLVGITFSNILAVRVVARINLVKREKNMFKVELSQKYQIVENVKALKNFEPHVWINIFFSLSSAIISYVIYVFVDDDVAYPTYFLVYNLFFMATSVYWIQLYWKDRRLARQTNLVAAAGKFQVKTALGDTVRNRQTVDEHFQQLKSMWK